MRMWMVDPRILCRQHLLGEHLELHMFVGSINKGINQTGYIKSDMLECTALHTRHEELVAEIAERKYKHNSPLANIDGSQASKIPVAMWNHKINKEAQLSELLSRCSVCRDRHASLYPKTTTGTHHETESIPEGNKSNSG